MAGTSSQVACPYQLTALPGRSPTWLWLVPGPSVCRPLAHTVLLSSCYDRRARPVHAVAHTEVAPGSLLLHQPSSCLPPPPARSHHIAMSCELLVVLRLHLRGVVLSVHSDEGEVTVHTASACTECSPSCSVTWADVLLSCVWQGKWRRSWTMTTATCT